MSVSVIINNSAFLSKRSGLAAVLRWLMALALAVPLLTSCDDVNKITDTIKDAQKALVDQSIAIQATMTKLEKDLRDEGRSAIAQEVQSLAQRSVATAGSELRCDAQFLREQMIEGLNQIIDKVTNPKHSAPPLTEYFCQAVPEQIDLSLRPEIQNRKILSFYGYNLDAGGVKPFVLDASGHEREVPGEAVASPTHYLVTVNISPTGGVEFTDRDQQLVFYLNGGRERRTITILASSRRFKIQGDPILVEGGGDGPGSAFREDCKDGATGVGFEGRAGGSVDAMALLCSPLNADGTSGVPSLTKTKGGDGGNYYRGLCPAGSILTAVHGHSAQYGRPAKFFGVCSVVTSVVNSNGIASSEIGGWGYWDGRAFAAVCNPGFGITGFSGRADGYVEHVGIVCRRIVSLSASDLR